MQDKPQTARFGTTLFLDNPLHRQAWELLSAIPAGQRTNWLCLALCQQAQREQFLKDLKAILQAELQNSSYPQTILQPQPAGSVDDDVLGFLRALQEEGDECRTIFTNILKFEGDSEQVHAMLDKIKSDELGFGSIDFNKIIPMPESLNIEAGSRTDEALYVCMMALNPAAPDMGVPKLSSEEYQKLAGIVGRSKGEQFMMLDAQRISRASKYTPLSDVIAMGQVVISNFLQYGCGDWYGWCNRNWGTKWNAYDVHFDQESQSIHFLTAWDTPMPVIDKLSQMFPEVEIDLQWADEDIGHNVGHVVLLAGEPIDGNIPEGGSREAYEMSFQIHGGKAADFNYVFDEKEGNYVYQEPERQLPPPKTKGDKPKEPER